MDENKEPVIGAIVQVSSGGIDKGGAATDIDGNYTIKPLEAGRYEVRISFTGYNTALTKDVIVGVDKTTAVNTQLKVNITELGVIDVIAFREPLIDIYAGGAKTLTAEEINVMPTRNTTSMVSTQAGAYQAREGGAVNLGGGRGDATLYIIDGVQVVGSRGINLPQGMIDQIQVFNSGLSARYGDAIGGVVSITTRGVTPTLQGGVLLEHSVDGYNHNLVNASLSGPLYSKKDSAGGKEPIIGFALAAEGYYDRDRNPTYNPNYVLKPEVLEQIQQNPLVSNGFNSGAFNYASEYVTKNDMDLQKRRIGTLALEGRLNGRLDFKLSDNLNLSAGGNFSYTKSNPYNRTWSLFAPEMPENHDYTGRAFVRLTQRFGKQGVPTTEGGEARKPDLISNAYYTLQVDYQRDYAQQQHADHKDNIFKYGYVGKFTPLTTELYFPAVDSATGRFGIVRLVDNAASGVAYQRTEDNPILANYTSQYFALGGAPFTLNQIVAQGGLINGYMPRPIYQAGNIGGWANVGQSVTAYSYSSVDQISATIDASFDFQPGKTPHAIGFGLYYQQRTSRGYFARGADATGGLWSLMRLLTNSHISQDLTQPIFIVNGQRYTKAQVDAGVVSPGPLDTIIYERLSNPNAQSTFDKNLRSKLGLAENNTDYLNVDGMDPSTFALDMFSPDELLNSGITPYVGYNGYTYTGEVQRGQVNFNDFFTKRDANGNYTREIGAYRPNYIAGYLLDKFQFKDLLFNVGVRVERFDANTKMLRDPYSLYETWKVGDQGNDLYLANNKLNGGATPSNIGEDYVVYVNDNASTAPEIIGYRNGDDWYDPFGRLIEDPTTLKVYSGGRDPQPYLTDYTARITDTSFNPDKSFTDYRPQVNVVPRISFSFPLSDQALFYAHYDVMVQRPDNVYATPADYYFFSQNNTGILNNPGLKPQKVFDYEFGFQQTLTQRSSIKLAAFYKERKDMIQIRPYLYAWPATYYTYGNRDFSTTKGFTAEYDLRRMGNIRMNLSYTLQFAEGTGSDDASANGGNSNNISSNGLLQNFISSGLPNLRFAFPLSYDSRHNIVANIDYRYDEGTGPVIAGQHILQNAGINFLFRTRSGEPYTRYITPESSTVQGGVQGSRLPWHYMLDMKVDKNFKLSFGKKNQAEGAPQKEPLYLNAFVLIQNLLNTRDVLGVYGYTSRPDDDGYLNSPNGMTFTGNQVNPNSFRDLYSIAIDNPNFINFPRRINIGLQLSF